jgi:TolA-binding protein
MKIQHFAAAAIALTLCASASAGTRRASAGRPVLPTASSTCVGKLQTTPATRTGVRLYQKGDYRQAAAEFDRVLASGPANYQVAYMLGMCNLRRGRLEDARDNFRQALSLRPDRKTAADIYNGLAASYETVRQTRMAHHHFHLACKSDRSNQYAQAGAVRTEYRHHSAPKPAHVARTTPQASAHRDKGAGAVH